MGFKEDLQKLSLQVNERMVHITNEETTKQSLIIPFIQVLGFDVYNPLEIKPEFVADFGKKRGEKVDYAIYKDNSPIMFIEAKSVNEKLSNHDAQLCRYFNAVKEVRLGIITNGIEYKFFTDLTSDNVIDETPFLIVDILNLKESDFENLAKFKKEAFDKEFLVKYAEELVYTYSLDENLKELFKNPNDEFIRFLIKDFSNTRITNTVIDRFRPIVKKSIYNAVLDLVSKGLNQQETIVIKTIEDPEIINNIDNTAVEENTKKRTIITTENELKSFDYIKGILVKAGKEIKNLGYKDTTSYFSVHNGNPSKWFFRITYDSSVRNVTTRLPLIELEKYCNGLIAELAPESIGVSRILINSFEDFKKLDQLIIYCFEQLNVLK